MHLYNTLTREVEPFLQIRQPVRMYVCGVTPQDEPHLGHAIATVVYEVLQTYMGYRGITVKRVQNFTDVDDKIIARASDLGVDPHDLAQTNIDAFFEVMDGLNVRPADVYCRVSEEMDEIITIIEELIDKDVAYDAGGSVYFRVAKAKDYGKLSNRPLEEATEAAMEFGRSEADMQKERTEDFALWKAQKPGEPAWESPWGPGRPGWHIECSAMARRYLGDQVDIHGGGLDLVFPHHENEVAQSEAANDVYPFARVWMHNGLLEMSGGQKMSKSLGNVVTVRDALKEHSPDTIRLWIFQSHYRSPGTYDYDLLKAAGRALRRLRNAVAVKSSGVTDGSVDGGEYEARFVDAMDADLNTPRALAVLFELAGAIERGATAGLSVEDARRTLRELCGILGLTLAEDDAISESGTGIDQSEIARMVAERADARERRDWATADSIRDQLAAQGIELEDRADGTVWRRG